VVACLIASLAHSNSNNENIWHCEQLAGKFV
jgi:hypothetical protein